MCGADSWGDVVEWGEDNETWLKRYMKLEHGTASHDIFRQELAQAQRLCEGSHSGNG
jgi:hypothetical protein